MTVGADGRLSELPAVTRGGYHFDGWYIDGQSRAVTLDTVYTSDTILHAHWKAIYIEDDDEIFFILEQQRRAREAAAAAQTSTSYGSEEDVWIIIAAGSVAAMMLACAFFAFRKN